MIIPDNQPMRIRPDQKLSVDEFHRFVPMYQAHQYQYLINPKPSSIVDFAHNITHHLLIQSEEDYTDLMQGMGWSRVQTPCLSDDLRFYNNMTFVPSYYKEMWGWFNYPDFYEAVAERINGNGVFVEVGTFWGRSIAFMHREIRRRDKKTMLYTCDPFQWPEMISGYVFPVPRYRFVTRNLQGVGASDVQVAPMYSTQYANKFPDKSVDEVFIDGDHKYHSVIADIDAWLPKMKPGGIMSGHDYGTFAQGVIDAVTERFGTSGIKIYDGSVWEVRL